MKDGLCLTYIKNGVMYQCGLSKDQDVILQNVVPRLMENEGGKIYVYTDKPIGDVINYNKETHNAQ